MAVLGSTLDMKIILAILLLPVLSFAAGYPPGTYSFTGLGSPTEFSPAGWDFSLWFTWDGGNIPYTYDQDEGTFTTGSITGGWYQEPREGGCCGDTPYPFSVLVNPDVFIVDIENGLLNGFSMALWNAGDPLILEVDFAKGTFYSGIVNTGTYGTFDARAPGYIEDPLLTPEPATWTLLLLGVAGIAARRRYPAAKLRR